MGASVPGLHASVGYADASLQGLLTASWQIWIDPAPAASRKPQRETAGEPVDHKARDKTTTNKIPGNYIYRSADPRPLCRDAANKLDHNNIAPSGVNQSAQALTATDMTKKGAKTAAGQQQDPESPAVSPTVLRSNHSNNLISFVHPHFSRNFILSSLIGRQVAVRVGPGSQRVERHRV